MRDGSNADRPPTLSQAQTIGRRLAALIKDRAVSIAPKYRPLVLVNKRMGPWKPNTVSGIVADGARVGLPAADSCPIFAPKCKVAHNPESILVVAQVAAVPWRRIMAPIIIWSGRLLNPAGGT